MLFSCTRNELVEEFGRLKPNQPAFELDNWTVQELRFFSSLYLGNGENGAVRPYPLPVYLDIDVDDTDAVISDAHLIKPLLDKLATDDYFMRGNSGLVAQSFEQYRLFEWTSKQIEHCACLWSDLDTDDDLVLRGLHALIKSDMLFEHFQFKDAALSASHIALDAAFCITVQCLKYEGVNNPSAADAQDYIDDLWNVPRTGRKFFEDYYRDRVRNFHTDNRYGVEAIPAFSLDDQIHLNAALKGLFFLFITGGMHTETQADRDAYLRHNFIDQRESN